uniref:E3 ubiquitin ligase UBR4 C-terminal domain-containing protein n=1 Tax=Odontella aurita TaxID=265563 RepID=A0A7S4NFE5_9STRA
MVFSTGPPSSSSRRGGRGGGGVGGGGSGLDADTPVSALPPMVVTYRLAGVDGEATEDKVEDGDLVDPEAPPATVGDDGDGDGAAAAARAYEEKMEREYGLTRHVAEGRGVSILLRSVEAHLAEVLRRVRRDDVQLMLGAASTSSTGATVAKPTKGGELSRNPSRAEFNKSPAHPALVLLRHCAQLADNRRRMVKGRAPTVLLRMLMDVLNAIDESSVVRRGRRGSSALMSDWASLDSGDGGEALSGGEAADAGNSSLPPSMSSVATGNNPTAKALQGLIEVLASDISADVASAGGAAAAMRSASAKDVVRDGVPNKTKGDFSAGNNNDDEDVEDEDEDDGDGDAALPLLLKSLRTTSLSPPLRRVIAKLLPFLTYGREAQSAALAEHFVRHVDVGRLSDGTGTGTGVEASSSSSSPSSVLMETFVQSAIALPPGAAVCEGLRSELGRRGFVRSVGEFLLRDIPDRPPPWSPALFGRTYGDGGKAGDKYIREGYCGKGDDGDAHDEKSNSKTKNRTRAETKVSVEAKGNKLSAENERLRSEELKKSYEGRWGAYFLRDGTKMALRILIGLCAGHGPTQRLLCDIVRRRENVREVHANERMEGVEKAESVETVAMATRRTSVSLLQALHWIESTSDNSSSSISLNGLGILAETLLDTLQDDASASGETVAVAAEIKELRKTTRERKRQIAEERRSRALVGMSSFGPLVGGAVVAAAPPELSPSPTARGNASSAGSASASASDTASVSASASAAPIQPQVVTADDVAAVAAAASSSGALGSALASMMGLSGFASALGAASSSSRRREITSVGGPSAAATVPSSAEDASGPSAAVDKAKPAWMLEMEAMEDETGLTCAVCQEGRTLQPSELLGLYAYVKKVTSSYDRCGGRGSVDGTVLLLSLPRTLPPSLSGTDLEEDWYRPARSAADALQTTPQAAAAMAAVAAWSSAGAVSGGGSGAGSSARPSHYVTTVTAGNAIHCSCHARARAADRNHPKAPKSEWEGAALRNSRVTCNVILPLVSAAGGSSTSVPLMAIESALADHQAVVSNLLGSGAARPRSMLWNAMHDVRLLLLRIAHGESLNADCGGGSLTSNAQLVFHMLHLAGAFASDAEHDSPETAGHARALDTGFLAGEEILRAQDFDLAAAGAGVGVARGGRLSSGGGGGPSSTSLSSSRDGRGDNAARRLRRGLADAAPMACLACILFHNAKDDSPATRSSDAGGGRSSGVSSESPARPHRKRRWVLHRDRFLRGLIRCAGRRRACGAVGSGCAAPSRGGGSGASGSASSAAGGSAAARRMRSASFSDWDEPLEGTGVSSSSSAPAVGSRDKPAASTLGKRSAPGIAEHASALRPMLILYAVFDALSEEYAPGMEDEAVEEAAGRLVTKIESCQKAKDIQDLMKEAGVNGMDHEAMLEEFLKGKEEREEVGDFGFVGRSGHS